MRPAPVLTPPACVTCVCFCLVCIMQSPIICLFCLVCIIHSPMCLFICGLYYAESYVPVSVWFYIMQSPMCLVLSGLYHAGSYVSISVWFVSHKVLCVYFCLVCIMQSPMCLFTFGLYHVESYVSISVWFVLCRVLCVCFRLVCIMQISVCLFPSGSCQSYMSVSVWFCMFKKVEKKPDFCEKLLMPTIFPIRHNNVDHLKTNSGGQSFYFALCTCSFVFVFIRKAHLQTP